MFKRAVAAALFSILLLQLLVWVVQIAPVSQVKARFTATTVSGDRRLATGDWQAPVSKLTVTTDQGEYEIVENINNGNFSAGLEGWESQGDITIFDTAEHGIVPKGQTMVRLGDLEHSTFLPGNSLSQTLESEEPMLALAFWYAIVSQETGGGFDEPLFRVRVNEEVVFFVSAQDLPGQNADGLRVLDWQLAIIPLRASGPTQISFESGNTHDNFGNTAVYLSEISTAVAIVGSENQVTITAYDTESGDTPEITYQYLGESGTIIQSSSQTSPALPQLPADSLQGRVIFWATDSAGNQEVSREVIFYYLADPPDRIEDAQVYPESLEEISVTFSAPANALDQRVSSYEAWLSPELFQFSDENGAANYSTFIRPSTDLLGNTPGPVGFNEDLLLKNMPAGSWFLSLRSLDQAGQWSEFSDPIKFEL